MLLRRTFLVFFLTFFFLNECIGFISTQFATIKNEPGIAGSESRRNPIRHSLHNRRDTRDSPSVPRASRSRTKIRFSAMTPVVQATSAITQFAKRKPTIILKSGHAYEYFCCKAGPRTTKITRKLVSARSAFPYNETAVFVLIA